MDHIFDPLRPMPLGDRMDELIRATEDNLAEGIQPLGHEFLCDHEVTLDEVYALSEHMALALKAYRKVPARSVVMAFAEATMEEERAEARVAARRGPQA